MNKEFSKELVKQLKWNKEGLIPAIVQDIESNEVLMLAYMNEEALLKTLNEGKACFFSRSRNSLWVKGETSGHYQEVVDVRFDCDQDSLLLLVKQTGMACHEDYFSCFHYKVNYDHDTCDQEATAIGDKKKIADEKGRDKRVLVAVGEPNVRPNIPLGRTLELLAETISKRNQERPEGSYTTYLFTEGIDKILKKVGEESAEVIIAAKNASLSEIRYETSDLLYHLLVMLEDRKVNLKEIAEELRKRSQ